jgi:hypothetical protein
MDRGARARPNNQHRWKLRRCRIQSESIASVRWGPFLDSGKEAFLLKNYCVESNKYLVTFTEILEFNRANLTAGQFITAATHDYVSCRCCLLNGLFSGLVLGAEAVEKYMKGFILYANPDFDVKQYNHRIRDLVSPLSNSNPSTELNQFGDLFDRLETYYKTRYPNNPGAATYRSTGELHTIDLFVLHIYDCLPIPEEAKFGNNGYFGLIFLSKRGIFSPYEEWLKRENVALQGVWNSLKERYQIMEQKRCVEMGST